MHLGLDSSLLTSSSDYKIPIEDPMEYYQRARLYSLLTGFKLIDDLSVDLIAR